MNARTAYLIQIIEKIGGPLLDAVSQKSSSGEPSVNEAQHLAELLGKTVQLSIELGKMIEIEKTEPEQSDSLRIALAGLASPIIADQYKNLSKAPGDAELQKLGSALEAVMTFSDNFTPSKENAQRLASISANGIPADGHQVNIQYIQAFAPVAHAVTSFSFGQAEKKMAQEAAEKITSKAKTICASVFGTTLNEDDRKLAELALIKSLAEIYTTCHTSEMNKLMAIQEPDDGAQTTALNAIWTGFDSRADILEALATNLIPKSAASSDTASTTSGSVAPAAAAATPQATPPTETQAPSVQQSPISQITNPEAQQAAPVTPSAPTAPPPTEQTQSATPPPAAAPQQEQAAGNPMSMFAKPKTEGEPPAAAPAQQAPPAAPTTPAEQPPTQPVAPPPEEQPHTTEPPPTDSGEAQQGGGGPMSFFKTPPNDGED